ncbi:ABC transporter permease, partial [Enterococcus faecium]
MKKKVSIGERSFTFFNNTFLILLALICIVPFLNIIATSFASTQEVVAKKFILF